MHMLLLYSFPFNLTKQQCGILVFIILCSAYIAAKQVYFITQKLLFDMTVQQSFVVSPESGNLELYWWITM